MHAVQLSSDAPCNQRSSSLVVSVCLCFCVGHMEHYGLQHCCRDDDVTHCPSWNAEEVRLCVLGMLREQGCCVAFISYAQSGVQFTTLSIWIWHFGRSMLIVHARNAICNYGTFLYVVLVFLGLESF